MSKNSNFGTKVPKSQPTWEQYCKDIGSSRQVVNRWLARWFDTPQLSEEEVKQAETKQLPANSIYLLKSEKKYVIMIK